MKKFIALCSSLVTAVLLLTALSCDAQAPADICVSIPPQAWLTDRIGGEELRVTVMVPPGTAPPTYAPTPSQLRDLQNSRLYIAIGHPDFHFEQKHIRPFLGGHPEIRELNMADSVDIIAGDAHIWMSPAVMKMNAERLYRELAALYPGKKEIFRRNYRNTAADIDSLDRELRKMFAPYRGREFFILHPALQYFCRDYGLRQISIRKDNKSASAKRLAELIDYAREHDIRSILIQEEFASEQLDIFAREIGATVVRIDPLDRSWLTNLHDIATTLERVFHE